MDSARRNSSVSSVMGVKPADARRQNVVGSCTFVRVCHGENQLLTLNSLSSCRRLLDFLKPLVGMTFEETIELMDVEGKLKELNEHPDEYASSYLMPRSMYYVLKCETNLVNGEKRYIPHFNMNLIEPKYATIFTTSINALNKSSNKGKRLGVTTKQNPVGQTASNVNQNKGKRTATRK